MCIGSASPSPPQFPMAVGNLAYDISSLYIKAHKSHLSKCEVISDAQASVCLNTFTLKV